MHIKPNFNIRIMISKPFNISLQILPGYRKYVFEFDLHCLIETAHKNIKLKNSQKSNIRK